MKDGYLFDALNEISDEHIAEAVTYEPKAKSIKWKAIIPIAACLIVVTVSLFAVTSKNPIQPTATSIITCLPAPTTAGSTTVASTVAPTSKPTVASTTAAPIAESTTVAGKTESTTSSGITEAYSTTQHYYCPELYSSWEEEPIYNTTPSFTFEGRTYCSATLSSYAPVFSQDKIKSVLKEDKMHGYTDDYEKALVDVLICEIEGVDKENAVVIGRKDGLQGGYCVYIEKSLYNTKNFSELLTLLNYKENLILSEHICMYPQNGGEPEIWISYYKNDLVTYFKENILDIYEGPTDIVKCKGDKQKAINEAFISILESNMEKAEYLDNNVEVFRHLPKDRLEFSGFICGYDFTVNFTEEGKLYFFTNAGITRYNLTEEDFRSFNSIVQGSN